KSCCDAHREAYTANRKVAACPPSAARCRRSQDCRGNRGRCPQARRCSTVCLHKEVRPHGSEQNRSLGRTKGNSCCSKINERQVSESHCKSRGECSPRGRKAASPALDDRDHTWCEDSSTGHAYPRDWLLHPWRAILACFNAGHDRSACQRCRSPEYCGGMLQTKF